MEHEHAYVEDTTFEDLGRPRFGPCTVCGAEPVLCAVCADPTPTSVPIHEDCLATEREVLDEIDRIVAAWPQPIREILTAVAYDISGITSADDKARLPFGLDAVTDDWFHHAAGIRTTSGALELLEEWERAWVEAGAGGGSAADPVDVLGYLRSRLVWAATNPTRSAFADYCTEARTVRARLRSLHGDGVEPVGAARCLVCEGELAHVRAVGVLDDLATCQRCGLAYDVAGIGDAIRARITTSPHQTPDALVT